MISYKQFRIHLARGASAIAWLAIVGCYYSPTPKQADSPVATSTDVIESSQTKGKAEDRYQAVLQMLDRESAKLKIQSLRATELDSSSEIRVWVGFGLAYSRCVILKKSPPISAAVYLGPRIVEGRADMNAEGQVILAKKELLDPKSGWINFDQFLKNQQIDFPIGLTIDERLIPAPDAEIIVIEAKSEERYSMVFFSVYSTSEDGKRAQIVCQKIEDEFGVTLGCSA